METLTIYPNEGTTTDEVLAFCAEWKANKHYPHNTADIVDFLARRLEMYILDTQAFQESARGLRTRLDNVEVILKAIVEDDPCYNKVGCRCCHDSMAKQALEFARGER